MNKIKFFRVKAYNEKDEILYNDIVKSRAKRTAITNVLTNICKNDDITKVEANEVQPVFVETEKE